MIPSSRGSPGSMPTSLDRKSTRLNSSHVAISYAVFCLKKKEGVVADIIEVGKVVCDKARLHGPRGLGDHQQDGGRELLPQGAREVERRQDSLPKPDFRR